MNIIHTQQHHGIKNSDSASTAKQHHRPAGGSVILISGIVIQGGQFSGTMN